MIDAKLIHIIFFKTTQMRIICHNIEIIGNKIFDAFDNNFTI